MHHLLSPSLLLPIILPMQNSTSLNYKASFTLDVVLSAYVYTRMHARVDGYSVLAYMSNTYVHLANVQKFKSHYHGIIRLVPADTAD